MTKKDDQKYLVIEEIDNIFRVSDILVDQDKNITLLDIREVCDFDELQKPTAKKSKIILALNSNHATTVEKEITIERSYTHNKIDEGEIDQLVFKTLWTFLDKYRNWSSKKMNVADLNIVLSEVEIKNTALNSKNVLDPVGLKGENITFRIRGTLIPRKFLEHIKKLKNISNNIKVVERLALVSIFCSRGDFNVHTTPRNMEIFSVKENEIKYKKKFSWGTHSLINSVATLFSVKDKTAVKILDKYFKKEVSKNIFEAIGTKINKNLETFYKNVRGITKKRKIDIFVNTPHHVYQKSLEEYSKSQYLDLSEIMKEKGFNVIMKSDNNLPYFKDIPESIVLAGADLFSTHYRKLNKMLRRRSKWLVPHT
ncbi:MAG TPA: hypothetical protein VKO61_00915 [Candidatus Paceibacterota bacterium]|nr:hypothetical protein [Candidatus Paceibacterota bacterium]